MSEHRLGRWVERPPEAWWAALVPPAVPWLPFEAFRPEIGHHFVARGPAGPVPCKVVDLEPPSRLIIAWNDPLHPSTVELTLLEESRGTRIGLVHRGIAAGGDRALEALWAAALRDAAPPPRSQRTWFAVLVAVLGLGVLAVLVLLAAPPDLRSPDPVPPAEPPPEPIDERDENPAVPSLRPPFRLGAVRVLQSPEAGPAIRGGVASPSWSVDGDHLAFEHARSDATWELFVAATDRAGLRAAAQVLLPGGDRSDAVLTNPTWMREGYLLFEASLAGSPHRLWYRAAAGGASSELFPPSVPGDLVSPVVSPEGHQLAFVSDGNGDPDVLLRDVRSGGVRPLAYTDAEELSPRFSPDSERVYFTREGPEGPDVFSVSVATREEALVAGGPGAQIRPNPAADGWVVWFEDLHGDDDWSLVTARGSERRVLAEGVSLPLWTPPALDPDGRLVAWGWDDGTPDDESGTIAVASVAGGPVTELELGGTGCREPAMTWWKGRFLLAATCIVEGERQIVVAEVETFR